MRRAVCLLLALLFLGVAALPAAAGGGIPQPTPGPPSPDPVNVPVYLRQVPAFVYDAATDRAVWVWSYSFGGPATGLVQDPRGNLWGDSWSFVKRGNSEEMPPLSPGVARLPVPGFDYATLRGVARAWAAQGLWVLPIYGQTGRMYKSSAPAVDWGGVPMPSGPEGVLDALPPSLYDRLLALGVWEYVDAEGGRWLRLGSGQVVSAYHRMSYTAVLKDGSHRDVTRLPLERWDDVVGEDPMDNYLHAASAPPWWDEPKPRPQKPGFYRAPQSWNPHLAKDWPQTTPGASILVIAGPSSWRLTAPAEVRAAPGTRVEIPLTVANTGWREEPVPPVLVSGPGGTQLIRAEGVRLGPGEEAQVKVPLTMPSERGEAAFFLNPPWPVGDYSPGLAQVEADYTDNAAATALVPQEPERRDALDIALALVYPKKLWTGMAVKIWTECWVAQGPGVTTDVVFSVSGQTASKRVTLPAGNPGAVVRTEFWVEAFEPGTLHLKAIVNPKRDPPEIRYDNNVFEVDVPVDYWSQGRKGTGVRVWLVK